MNAPSPARRRRRRGASCLEGLCVGWGWRSGRQRRATRYVNKEIIGQLRKEARRYRAMGSRGRPVGPGALHDGFGRMGSTERGGKARPNQKRHSRAAFTGRFSPTRLFGLRPPGHVSLLGMTRFGRNALCPFPAFFSFLLFSF